MRKYIRYVLPVLSLVLAIAATVMWTMHGHWLVPMTMAIYFTTLQWGLVKTGW